VFRKFVYICLWLCVLSGTASTATPPGPAPPAAPSARAVLAP
jgi:hypothetical protein